MRRQVIVEERLVICMAVACVAAVVAVGVLLCLRTADATAIEQLEMQRDFAIKSYVSTSFRAIEAEMELIDQREMIEKLTSGSEMTALQTQRFRPKGMIVVVPNSPEIASPFVSKPNSKVLF